MRPSKAASSEASVRARDEKVRDALEALWLEARRHSGRSLLEEHYRVLDGLDALLQAAGISTPWTAFPKST